MTEFTMDERVRAWLESREPGPVPAALQASVVRVPYEVRRPIGAGIGDRIAGLPLVGSRSRELRWALVAIAILISIGAVAVVGSAISRPTVHPPLPTVVSPQDTNGWVAFSANGQAGPDLAQPVDSGRGTGAGDIYLTREGGPIRRVIGSEGDLLHQTCPAFSPDGTMLAHLELDMRSVTTTAAPAPQGAAENTPGPDVGPPRFAILVHAISSDGDLGQLVARIDMPPSGGATPSCAEWSSDGKRLAFAHDPSGSSLGLWVATLDGSEPRIVSALGTMYAEGFAWDPSGSTLAFLDPQRRVSFVSPEGGEPSTIGPADVETVSWSPDGRSLGLVVGDSATIMDIDGAMLGSVPIALPGPDQREVEWSPDGKQLAFVDGPTVVVVAVDGTERIVRPADVPEMLEGVPDAGSDNPPTRSIVSWSPDGKRLLIDVQAPDEGGALVSIPVAGTDPGQLLVRPTPAFRTRPDGISWQAVHE